MYRKDELKMIFNHVMSIKDKEKKIEEGLALMFEEQYMPFLNYNDVISTISLVNPRLGDIFNYMFYEMHNDSGSVTYPDGVKLKLKLNLKSFLAYCKKDGILT